MYSVFPNMQKILEAVANKADTIEETVVDHDEAIEELKNLADAHENRLKGVGANSDLNILDLLNADTDEAGGENNKILIKAITTMENKLSTKLKNVDDRLLKLEQVHYKLNNDVRNIKGVNDLTKRNIDLLKKANEEINQRFENIEKNIDENCSILNTKITSKIDKLEKNNEKKYKELNKSKSKDKTSTKEKNVNKESSHIDTETQEKISEIEKMLSDIEKNFKNIPNMIGLEQIKSDISALKSGMGNYATNQDMKDLKEKTEELERLVHFNKEQFDEYTSNQSDHDDIQNLKRKVELLNSKVHDMESVQQETLLKLNQSFAIRAQEVSNEKYLDIITFDEFKSQIIKEFNNVNDNFTHLRKLVDTILDSLKNKPSYRDIKALEEDLLVKIEDLRLSSAKKFAERIETTKNIKYLDQQIKNIYQIYIKKVDKSENWLLAKKPLNANLCASCESYIGDLKDNSMFVPWNKYPMRDPNDKLYKYGSGFSKMLQMIQVDENDKKVNSSVPLQTMTEFDVAKNVFKNDPNNQKLNTTSGNGINPFKKEKSNEGSDSKDKKKLPKIKQNISLKKNNNLNNSENSNSQVELKVENTEGNEKDIYNNEISEEGYDEEQQPKITKIVRRNKE